MEIVDGRLAQYHGVLLALNLALSSIRRPLLCGVKTLPPPDNVCLCGTRTTSESRLSSSLGGPGIGIIQVIKSQVHPSRTPQHHGHSPQGYALSIPPFRQYPVTPSHHQTYYCIIPHIPLQPCRVTFDNIPSPPLSCRRSLPCLAPDGRILPWAACRCPLQTRTGMRDAGCGMQVARKRCLRNEHDTTNAGSLNGSRQAGRHGRDASAGGRALGTFG